MSKNPMKTRRWVLLKQEQIELLEMDKSGIHVAEYLTDLPSKELLEQLFHQALQNAKSRVDDKGF